MLEQNKVSTDNDYDIRVFGLSEELQKATMKKRMVDQT